MPLTVLLILSSCIKKIDVETRNVESILVVEGGITNDTVPCTVKLSYSGPFKRGNVIPDDFLEKEANVAIVDDLGNKTTLTYKGEGIYETTDPEYVGRVGRSYSVIIDLKNGTQYISVPETIKPSVRVSDISTGFNFYTPSRINVSVDVNDPATEENYYSWSFYSWAPRKTDGISCGFGCIVYDYCFQKFTNRRLSILSDAAVNGRMLNSIPIGTSPIYWFGDHYIDIRQHSISRSQFHFYEMMNDQISRSGNILDPLPAPIKGNVYKASDPNDFALGYFSASSVRHVRAILLPYNITQFLLDQTAAEFIPAGPRICFEAFPDALFYPPPPARQNPPPPGWENAQVIEVRW